MKFFAITINRKEIIDNLNTLNSAYNWLETFSTVYTLSRETNELNNNTHYHALVSAELENDNFIFSGVWLKELDNNLEILKYLNYIKKDGKFKIYKRHSVENDINEHWTLKALKLVLSYDNLKDLFTDNPDMIKYIYHIEKLYNIKERS